MKREEQINKAVEDLLDDAEISMEDRPLLRMWYKLGVNFADKNPIDRTDWQQVRIQASIAAMQGICANDEAFVNMSNGLIVRNSVGLADALVKELKGEKQ